MIEGYNTIHEKAEQWKISERTLQTMFAEGRIPGVAKFGKSWAIPFDAGKPKDGHIVSGKYRNWQKSKQSVEKRIYEGG